MSASYSHTHLVNVNLDISLWWEKTNRTRPSEGMESPRVTKFRHKTLVGKTNRTRPGEGMEGPKVTICGTR